MARCACASELFTSYSYHPRNLELTESIAKNERSRTRSPKLPCREPGSSGTNMARSPLGRLPIECTRSLLARLLGQKLDQLYFQTYPLNARFPGFCVFNQTFSFSFSFDCFCFQIRSELFDSDLKKFNFDDSASRFLVSTPRSCQS